MANRIWSDQQQHVFHYMAKDQAYFDLLIPDIFVDVNGHLVVRARAGTGKTTTIIEAINFAPEQRIILCAFNSRIAKELSRRLTNPNAQSRTLNSLGYRCVLRYWPGQDMEKEKSHDRERSLTEAVCNAWEMQRRKDIQAEERKLRAEGRSMPFPGPQLAIPPALRRLVTILHSKGREIEPRATMAGDLLELADRFDCEPGQEWEDVGLGIDVIEDLALQAMELAATVRPIATGIDFADQIFLPIRNNWMQPEYDLVVVDEAQDMTAAQLLLARGISRGRICIVGDDRQAMYGFRGADSDSIDRLKLELHASELGLNTTYRCGKNIVAHAARIVVDFFAHPTAHDGEIRRLSSIEAMIQETQPGDFILSRKNAPLAAIAMAMIRAEKRVVVTGRDIGAGLIALTDKLAKGPAERSIPEFLKKVAVWEERQIKRAMAADKPEKLEGIQDKAETLHVLTEGVPSVWALKERLRTLFTDTADPATVTTCSSVHKAKGLEADRVYVLEDTLHPTLPSWAKVTSARMREEQNIEYVAVTRAKHTLVLVNVEKAPDPQGTLAFEEAGV